LLIMTASFIQAQEASNVVLVIHGGAGTILKENMTPEKEKAYQEKLQEALQAGYVVLKNNGTSTEAVRAAINVMEDSPLFNAGKGAVYTNHETQEMDASIMEGKNKEAGAVAGVSTVKNPIDAALAVMEKSEHVLLIGSGAEKFAKTTGVEMVNPDYFKSERRLKQLKRIQEKEKSELDHDGDRGSVDDKNDGNDDFVLDKKYGTVGAVALDQEGNISAGTSTGGMTNKRYNRVGDSPVIGAGTYADNETCGVSCTGHGEYFIRNVVAYDVCALMNYTNKSVAEATQEVIKKQSQMGGKGGVIALDAEGNMSMPFNTAGMFRGYITKDGEMHVFMYGEK
ncbi:putative isoaspartyl peptidase/L-asparaginase, partial [Exaiptasia diaphana]